MKIEEFNKLKSSLELFAFEKNFKKLAKTLYYFSFLGNIFLVLFSYFFIKNVTDSIPPVFTGQDIFFGIFVFIFMSMYELFKRFSFEQLTLSILRAKEFTINLAIGIAVCLALIMGSFYLSINGAHRLIDTTDKIEQVTQVDITHKQDSIEKYYNRQIAQNQSQITKLYNNDTDGLLMSREKASLAQFQKNIKDLDSLKKANIKALEIRYAGKDTKQLEKVGENNLAFILLVFFLEFIILIGVGFEAYYVWNSYDNMKGLLGSARFKELELNLKLLRIYYQDGRRKKEEETIDKDKFIAVCSMQNLDVDKVDLDNFLQLLHDLGIISRRKMDNNQVFYVLDYVDARQLLENQIYL